MNRYYKNISKNAINIKLFGVGVVNVPAEAACVELDPSVVNAINTMAFPNVILEEVEATITAANAPIAKAEKAKKKAPAKKADTVEEVVEEDVKEEELDTEIDLEDIALGAEDEELLDVE